MFLWTCWIQFWQLSWSLVVKCPFTFRARSENSQKILVFQTTFFLLKMLLGTRRKYFRKPWQFFVAPSPNSFCAISKKILEIMFLPGKVIDSNCSFLGRRRKQSRQPCRSYFARSLKKLCKNLGKSLKK